MTPFVLPGLSHHNRFTNEGGSTGQKVRGWRRRSAVKSELTADTRRWTQTNSRSIPFHLCLCFRRRKSYGETRWQDRLARVITVMPCGQVCVDSPPLTPPRQGRGILRNLGYLQGRRILGKFGLPSREDILADQVSHKTRRPLM